MFKIRALQMKTLSVDAIMDFEARMLVHIKEFFPTQYVEFGEEEVRKTIQYGIERAATYGIRSERGVCSYVDVMFGYGHDFDRDPSLPWAQTILLDKEYRNDPDRAIKLFDAAFDATGDESTSDYVIDYSDLNAAEVIP